MYYPVGWPKQLHIPQADGGGPVRHMVCNRDRILFAIITDQSIAIWFCKPCVQILSHHRSQQSLASLGTNQLAEWRSDSSMIAVVTSKHHIIFYNLDVDTSNYKSLYEQLDSKTPSLKRETAELFVKETILPLSFVEAFTICVGGGVTSLACIRDELMLPTKDGRVERLRWDGTPNSDYSLNLSRVPFCVDQQHSRAIPIEEPGVCIIDIEYSPVIGGFAVVFSDGRAAFLTASSLKFDPNQVQGIWAQELQDATCAAVNHKYRLIAFGRRNANVIVYNIEEITGALQISQKLELSSKDYPDASTAAGSVSVMKWTPDGCAIAIIWEKGGISVWSVFGSLLMCSLGWDYGIMTELMKRNPFHVQTMEWGAEGYQLWMGMKSTSTAFSSSNMPCHSQQTCVALMQFVKSALTVNPSMSNQEHVFLQGEDRLYINAGDAVVKVFRNQPDVGTMFDDDLMFCEVGTLVQGATALVGNKQWIVIPIPYTYTGSNWPIRYTALDQNGHVVAIAGRTGVAHYSLHTRKWKLFGNETQEKDFVVTGGLMWWQDYLVMGCYNILEDRDEIRLYPRESKLDNLFVRVVKVLAQVLMINQFWDKLIVFCADSHISLYSLVRKEMQSTSVVHVMKLQDIDISSLCIHPACVVSIALTSLRTETARHSSKDAESILINVCGRLIMIQRDSSHNNRDEVDNFRVARFSNATVLASCVENVWVSSRSNRDKQHLTEALWLGCGAHGLKVWLPLFPRDGEKSHNFMSRRIMLPFNAHIYPLGILFEDGVILGAESDTMLFSNDPITARSALPFCVIERTSQVYLHHIIRQLLRRNLGFHAWEIARSCASLPYFPHSLELLLHEVLEEEATSKEPIPDALLPRVIEFIREFPVYLQTVVQCARKTEIALWQYLFSAVGNPQELFQECLDKNQLETAASYLIILQSLELSLVSRQHATVLLDASLDHGKWELSKDLVRFLRAIDPSDVESPPRSTMCMPQSAKYSNITHPASPITPCEDDLSLVLGTMQVPRGRTLSVTSTTKPPSLEGSSLQHKDVSRSSSDPKAIPAKRKSQSSCREGPTAEEFFIDVILHRHTRKLLSACRLRDLGSFAAHLDIHLVAWLRKERNRAAKLEDFVTTLKKLHHDFQWPYPLPPHPASYYLNRKSSGSSIRSGASSASPLEEKMKALMIDVGSSTTTTATAAQIGDSGYLSNVGPDSRSYIPTAYDAIGNQTVEAHLRPHIIQEDGSLHTVEISEESSYWGDAEHSFLDENTWNNIQLASDLEMLSRELANKGPQQSEIQLRYLLQLMMEAGCLEFALLISIVLRDAMAVIRTINASRTPELSHEVPVRLKEGLHAIDYWADTACFGYKPFMQAIRNQFQVLSKIIRNKPKSRHPSSSDQSSGERPSVAPEESLPIPAAQHQVGPSNPQEPPEDAEEVEVGSVSSSTSSSSNDSKQETKQPQPQQQQSGSDCVIS